jgi:hypothetical protein
MDRLEDRLDDKPEPTEYRLGERSKTLSAIGTHTGES